MCHPNHSRPSLTSSGCASRRIALASTASLALTALTLVVGFVGGTGVARAQTTQTFTQGYYVATSGTSFTVPTGITSIQIQAWGGGAAGGGGRNGGIGGGGGGGGFAGGTFGVGTVLTITPGQALTILVGGGGTGGRPGSGGTNGGGSASYGGGSGGGYSAVYLGTTSGTLLVVAGGGGGGGYAENGDAPNSPSGGAGGAGGGTGSVTSSGTVGAGTGGGSGTAGGGGGGGGGTAAGSGGTGGSTDGSAGSGMSGGDVSSSSSAGGGGGGGYRGGGQGGTTSNTHGESDGGGGGGSSFVAAAATVSTLTGGSGTVPGNQSSADYQTGVGLGTPGTGSGIAATGSSGEVFLRLTATITSFDYTGSGLSGSASAPTTGAFSTGFYYTLTSGNGVSPLTFAGGPYVVTDDLTSAPITTGLTFTNTGDVTLARSTVSGASNTLNLTSNNSTGTLPTIALNNTGDVTVGLDLSLNKNTTVSGAGSATFTGAISNNKTLTMNGTGTLTLANTLNGSLIISSGTVRLGDGATSNGFVTGNITDNAALIFANPTAQTYSGIIGGTGTVTKVGAGTESLTGNNAYSGGTTISAGTLSVFGSTGVLGTGTVTINGGTLSAFGNFAVTLPNAITLGSAAGLSSGTFSNGGNVHNAGLTLSGPVTLNSSTNATGLTVTGSSRVAITGVVGEASGQPTVLVKSGAGTLELDRDNTYSGGTLVAQGTLVVNNNYAAGGFTSGMNGSGTGTGAVTIAPGATLTGAYVIRGAVQNNGTLAVGNSIGVGSVGALTLAGGSALDFELGTDGSTSDRIDVTSLLSRTGSGGIDFDLTGEHLSDGTLNPISAGTFTLLTFGASNGLSAGDFFATGLPTGWTSNFVFTNSSGSGSSYRPGSLSVVVGAAAPEPSVLLLTIPGAAGMVGLAARRRKGRKGA